MQRWTAFLMALCAAWLAALQPAPAFAQLGASAGLRSDCHATGAAAEALSAVLAAPARWRCAAGEPSLSAERAILRFTVPANGVPQYYFATRTSIFDRLTVAVVSKGRIVQRSYVAETILVGRNGRLILVPLPVAARGGDSVVIALDGAVSRGLFHDARLLSTDPMQDSNAMIGLLLAAVVCGMLFMPLAFNAAYYRVLREKFVLWHLALTTFLLVQCLLNSGIVGYFFAIPLPIFARLGIVSFGASVAAAAAFCAAFIEPRKLDRRLRKALFWCAGQVLVTTLLHAAWIDALGALQTPLYFASFLPVLVVFFLVLADAWRRGSRAVRYQLVGWAPFLTVGVTRMVTMLVPGLHYSDAYSLFYVAMVVESIAVSLGVADRFMTIKHQRDRALVRATSLERLSERDDLTGLYNRRALDGPLGNFSAQRFTGFALFDLDNFKRVNDTHGHAVGDAVLRTVASVLAGHKDAVALRMGGEEFLLLLQGEGVAQRVERLREAIPVRIAREVAELELLVTSSAGLVEAAAGDTIGNDFVALYRRADDLLYEAKHNGRNLLAAVTLPAQPAAAAAAAA